MTVVRLRLRHESAGPCQPALGVRDSGIAAIDSLPAAFARLDDLALSQTSAAAHTLRGTDTDQTTLARRLHSVSRTWLVEIGGDSAPAPLAASGLHRTAAYSAGDITVTLYER